MISVADDIVLRMLRSRLAGGAADGLLPESLLSGDVWPGVYSAAVRGGVTAMLWNVVSRLGDGVRPGRTLRLQWGLGADSIRERYRRQRALATELAGLWAAAGIGTVCLKGLALSELYPDPETRECGDFDCWLGDGFARGNEVAVSHGALFDPHDYRHSLLIYKGMKVENHRFFLAVRGNRRHKRLERYLRSVIGCDRLVGGSVLHAPSPQFHALFLAMHALHHFLYEGVRLRHLCDWTCFVGAERCNVDWAEFNARCDEAGAARFVAALNAVCVRHLGLRIDGTALRADERFAGRVLADTLGSSRRVSGIDGLWRQRMAKIGNMVSQRWKFRGLYDRGPLRCMLGAGIGIVADPHPGI